MKIGKDQREQCNKSTLENAWDEGLTISLCHLNVIYNTAGWDYAPKASRLGPVQGAGERERESACAEAEVWTVWEGMGERWRSNQMAGALRASKREVWEDRERGGESTEREGEGKGRERRRVREEGGKSQRVNLRAQERGA